MAKKHINRCSTSLIIRGMQIKSTMRYNLSLARMAIVKKSTNKFWRGCRKKRTLLHCCWECKLVQPLWRTVWKFLKLKIEGLPWWSSGKESALQCRGRGFNPGQRTKIPHAAGQLSPRATTAELAHLN